MVEELTEVTDRSTEFTPGERRRHSRYPFTATVEVVEPNSKTRIQGRTSDLSRGGCYVDTTNSFSTDTIVEMRFRKENQLFEAQAKVVYCLDGMGMGLQFIPAAPEQMRILDKWIGQLNGELTSEPEVLERVEEPCFQGPPKDGPYYVLNQLIIELMRQGILSDIKCKALLQQLHGGEQADSKIPTAKVH
jgi:hypothetical protein